MKAIIWRRGSTDRQEIETQDVELTELAIDEGFEEEELIHLGEAGASAIKQNELYQREVNELISTLDKGDVSTVFVWEISRLARVELAFYKMKDYFIKNHIQLICKTPSLHLFDKDGKVNKGTELTLSLLVTLAKQEMEIKQERFKRAKARNKAEGKFTGGRIKFGYRLNKTKHFEEDEHKGQIVRQIFDWYVNDKISLTKIYQRLVDMEVYPLLNARNSGGNKVAYIIRDTAYIGANNYPSIVSKDIFDKANDILSKVSKPHYSKNIFFCKGLLKDKNTNLSLTPRITVMGYAVNHRDHRLSLNINAMDTIALYSANILIAKMNAKEAQTNRNDYLFKIDHNKKIILSKSKQISQYEEASQRAIEMNILRPTHFPKERMDAMLNTNDNMIGALKNEIADLESENTRMTNWLNGNQQFINTILDVSDERKKEMIDTVIKRIEVTRMPDHYRIDVLNKIGIIEKSHFEYSFKGNNHIIIEEVYDDGRRLELSIHKRLKRNRYNH